MISFMESVVLTPLASAIGWTIVHSLWEGAVVALALAAVLAVARAPGVRYAAAGAAMLILVVTCAVTFVRVMPEPATRPHTTQMPAPAPLNPASAANPANGLSSEFGGAVPWLAPIWIAGVL